MHEGLNLVAERVVSRLHVDVLDAPGSMRAAVNQTFVTRARPDGESLSDTQSNAYPPPDGVTDRNPHAIRSPQRPSSTRTPTRRPTQTPQSVFEGGED